MSVEAAERVHELVDAVYRDESRRVFAAGISAALNAPIAESTFGIFRM